MRLISSAIRMTQGGFSHEMAGQRNTIELAGIVIKCGPSNFPCGTPQPMTTN